MAIPTELMEMWKKHGGILVELYEDTPPTMGTHLTIPIDKLETFCEEMCLQVAKMSIQLVKEHLLTSLDTLERPPNGTESAPTDH